MAQVPIANAQFLSYQVEAPDFQRFLAKEARGTAQKGVYLNTLASAPVWLAPLNEQHRIVEALESYLSRLDDAVAILGRVQRSLKRYRASVLTAAIEGRLVPTEAELARAEGRSYEPASVLLDRILRERRRRSEEAQPAEKAATGKAPKHNKWKAKYEEPDTTNLPQLPEGWSWARLDQLFSQRLGKMLDSAKNTGQARPYLRNANVRWFSFDLLDVKLMRVQEHQLDDVSIKRGDLVVCEGGEPGRAAVWRSSDESFVIQKACHRLRPGGSVNSFFYAFVLAAEANSGRLAKEFTGSTIKHLTGERLCPFVVPLPPAAEQVRVVEELQRVITLVDNTDREVHVVLARIARLRQSILKWAFEGRLINQDPADEPASVLLERIRAERASVSAVRLGASAEGKKLQRQRRKAKSNKS